MFLKMYEAVAIVCIFIVVISFKLIDSEKYEKNRNYFINYINYLFYLCSNILLYILNNYS